MSGLSADMTGFSVDNWQVSIFLAHAVGMLRFTASFLCRSRSSPACTGSPRSLCFVVRTYLLFATNIQTSR